MFFFNTFINQHAPLLICNSTCIDSILIQCICGGFVTCGFVYVWVFNVCMCEGDCNVWVYVCVCFVMCWCFGNMFTCIYCVLYLLCFVFLLFLLCIFILICYQCKDYCHRVKSQLQQIK